MIFKRISLQGFKSFVEKTDIDFPKGVTCIVGPNGSGKSNILDAIRWVFGEQSAKELRGSDMEDIVFAGSENRKPSGFAQVSLTLDELDEDVTAKWGTFSEITLTRKFYKTGEREYLINNRKCKLKDIKEIFYDTGIGARSISIIEQGKVEKIIQSSPEELRQFFEETAGVVKFKERKKEAEKRLDGTKENLSRVNDIISEVKQTSSQLQAQLQKLNKYKALLKQKENLTFTFLFNSFENCKNKYAALSEQYNALLDDINNNSNNLEKLKKHYSSKKEELSKLQESYKSINEKLIFLIEEINKCDSEIKILQNRIDGAEETKKQTHSEIDEKNQRLKILTDDNSKLKQSLSDVKDKKEVLQQNMDDLTGIISELELQKEEAEDDLSDYKDMYLNATQKLTDIRNEIYRNETDIANFERDITKLTKEMEEILANKKNAESDKNRLETELAEVERDISALEKSLSVYDEKLKDVSNEIADIEKEIEDLRINYASAEKSLELYTKQLKSETFEYQEDEKLFSEYDVTYLVDYFSGMGYELLKEFGDVLVINVHNTTNKSEIIKDISSAKGSYKFIFSDELDSFEKFILGSDIEVFSEHIIKYDHIYRKYGYSNKSTSVITLKNNIRAAEAKLTECQSLLRKYRQNHNKLLEKKNLYISERKKIKESMNLREKKINEIKNDLDTVVKDLLRDEKRYSIIAGEIEMYKHEMKDAQSKNETLRHDLEEISQKQNEYDTEIEHLEEKVSFLDNQIDERKEELNDIKIELRGYQEQINSLNKQIHYVEKDISITSKSISSLNEKLSRLLTVDIDNWSNMLDNKQEELRECKKKHIEAEDLRKYYERSITALTSEIQRLSEDIDSCKSTIANQEKKSEKLYFQLTQIKKEMDDLQEEYREKYDSSDVLGDLKEFADNDFNPSIVKQKIREVEKSIEDLGPLNMVADQEYEEVSSRLDFLVKQREDLENAINTIYELIREIDDSTVKQFKETFYSVRKHFLDIFKILFGEGKADLKLTDEHDMLKTGVEIFVQPPGKRLQNMNLLSGGEKAMTACTLLFAMFLHKPTPFCFLDEIDAPLDDANIGRFVKIVRQLSDKSQFVIISHNQKTIENADSLYGVTMQEPGVSKILSVRLDKNELPQFIT